MAFLKAIKGLNPGQIFPLEGDSIILGRNSECDIVLEVGAVSRHHARIVRAERKYYVEDLASRNGTFLNEKSVEGRKLLEENDQIQVCDLVFVFHGQDASDNGAIGQGTADFAMLVDDQQVSGGSTIMSKMDVSTSSTGLRLTIRPEAKLKALIEIGKSLSKAISLDDVLPKLLDSLFSIFVQADRGFVVLKDQKSGQLVPMAVKHRSKDDTETVRISRTIVVDAMDSKEAILSADAASDSRFEMAESIIDFKIRSMICTPLIDSEGNALGVIQIDTLDSRKRFNQDDLEVLASVASQVASAIENAQLHETVLRERELLRELDVAHEVQQGFLPDQAPSVKGYGFFDFYEPASQLGGDYFDYVTLPDGRVVVVLADVSGKGISAALLVAKLSAEIRYCLINQDSPVAAVEKLNNVFCHEHWEDRFVTLVMVVIDPARHQVVIVNAGHMSPLLRYSNGRVEPIGENESGLPIGISADTNYEQFNVSLTEGDSLTLYTDGITEAMNERGELYGGERLRKNIESEQGNIKNLGRRILTDVKRFVGTYPQSDDMCLACFGRSEVDR